MLCGNRGINLSEMKKTAIIILPILILSFNIFGQKIKYKDLFPILDAKNYEQGIPTLNKFLSDPKNINHPNGNLQKGLYYEYLIKSYHLITDSVAVLNHTDSAVIFLSKAKSAITEKELKKRDEYYQSFHRRDLRSGEFGIKLSDVQLDIEKKIKNLQKLNKNAAIIYEQLAIAKLDYNTSNEAFRKLATLSASENEYMLMATDEQIANLDEFIKRGDNVKSAFNKIRDAVSVIRIKGYSPELNVKSINDFTTDGRSDTDLFQNDVSIWDYGTWADDTKRKINRDILRMREHLTRVYEDLNARNERVKSGSGIRYEELSETLDENLVKALHEFDEYPLPEKLLNILIEDTKYRFLTKPTLNLAYSNQEDVDYQLSLSDSLITMIDNILDQTNILTEVRIADGTKKYKAFLKDNYGGDFGLLSYRDKFLKKYNKAKETWTEKRDVWYEKSKWGVSEDLMDSIYLIGKSDSLYEAIPLSRYYTIAVDSDDSSYVYAVGLEFTGDIDKGFLAKIGKDRTILWKENFDLGQFQYSDSAILVISKFIPTEEGNISAYIYSYVPETPSNLLVINVNKSGEINWTNELVIARPPVNTKYNSDVKETYLYYISEEELEYYDGEDSGYIVIDRRGKVR